MSKLRLSQLDELKDAILHLPQKEKDKLLIRLINKDQMLIKQLHFQLLENEQDLWDRHRELELELHESFMKMQSRLSSKNSNTRFQMALILLRELSGRINEHASITKSKDSELKLRLKVIRWSIEHFTDLYTEYHTSKFAMKFYDYQKSKLKMCFSILSKLHEDLQYEFKEDIRYVVSYVQDISTIKPLLIEWYDTIED